MNKYEEKRSGKKSIFVFGILFLAVMFTILFSSGFVSATATESNPQLSLFSSLSSNSVSLGSGSSNSGSSFDSSMCTKSQDFVVQVSPLGCEPTIVRSDLLSQQNVQVYCPLMATQLNPLINVKSINGISFVGNYSSEISSVGFYPAQAALNTNSQSLNAPALNNIGYAVINLKQMPNESAMPDYVSGNLTASMSYNAQNAFGLGSTNFYIPAMTDSEWQNQYPLYSFLNGKGYLRVDNIYDGKATISVYNSNLGKISTVTLSPGETSNDLSIPGFDLCSASMKIKLDSLSNPGIFAKLEVNGNPLDASNGQQFLGNNCRVQKISNQGLTNDVQIACTTSSGTQVFELRSSDKVILNINGKNQTAGLGDFLYQNNGKYVYLAYIDSTKAGQIGYNKPENLRLVLVQLPTNNGAQLSQENLSSFASLVSQITPTEMTNTGFTNAIANLLKAPIGLTNLFLRNIASGQNVALLTFNDKPKGVFNSQIQIEGFASPQNSNLQNSLIQKYYANATNDYQSILNSYPSETYPSGNTPVLGEKALYQQMKLALALNQKNDLLTLCQTFKQRYPNAKEDISFCSDSATLSSSSISSQYVLINGQAYQISFKGISVPTVKDYSATVAVQSPDGKTTSHQFTLNGQIIPLGTSGDFIKLDSLTQGSATITTKPGNAFQSSSHVLNLNTKVKIGDYNFTLTNVQLSQMAQVSIEPKSNDAGSQAVFPFNISIEKRTIQLTPDQVKKQIQKTNQSIAEWEKISSVTGKVLNVSKNACVATSAVLTVANLISNLGGTGLARTKVMEGAGGWNDKCKAMVSQGQYRSLDDCFIKNSKQINSDVNQTTFWMNQQNKQIGDLQKQYTTKPSGLSNILSSGVVNTNEFMKSYSINVQSSLSCLGSSGITNPLNPSASPISISDAKSYFDYGSYQENNYNVGQAKNVQLYSEIICSGSSSDSLKSWAKQQIYSTVSDVQTNAKNYASLSKAASSLGGGTSPRDFAFLDVQKGTVAKDWTGKTVGDYSQLSGLVGTTVDLPGKKLTISSKTAVQPLQVATGGEYLLLLDNSLGTSKYPIVGVYNLDGTVVKNVPSDVSTALQKVYFQKVDASSFQNAYKNPEVKYFETAPYQGVPAIVPFDLKNGWYAAIRQTSPVLGNSLGSSGASVDSSGRVESFWLCNVGSNGLEEFDATMNSGSKRSYDNCQSIDLNTQSTYTQFGGLSQSETTKLVGQALDAIKQAQQQYHSGVSSVLINGQNIKVGTPATDNPSIQCEDFMSPTSCNILFNVCDPVVCPASRCNFGGAFPVKDVVQTGVIGSTLLCLPNSVLAGGTDYLPVCLPGIQSGIDSFISVQKSYEQCLQNNLATGQTTGICGEIYDLYGCNLFWQNAVPLAKIGLSKAIEATTGQGAQGGAEYMNVQNALSNAQNSMNYMTNSYASNALKAFQVQSTQGVGVGFCKNFIQTVFPSGAKLVNQLSTTDSPPQYMGSFSEMPFTTATVPPTSQYNVYFHIYAGQNAGAYYSVYLENSGGSYYQDTSAQYVVDSGYISAGDSADKTKDFTAPSGYKQLCINVNGNTQCGFKEVSTSLAVNAIKDYYVASQVNQTGLGVGGLNENITTENQCRYGAINLGGASINLQSAPSLGITRVCATKNPGDSTDPNAGNAQSRWVEVGYCGNKNLGCWLDTQSVKDAINSPDIMKFLNNGTTTTLQNSTLQNLQNSYASVLQNSGKYLTDSQFNSELKKISFDNPQGVIATVGSILGKVLYNNQKGELLLLRGEAYGLLALEGQSVAQAAEQTTNTPPATTPASTAAPANAGASTTNNNGGSSGVAKTASAQPTGATSSKITPDIILQIMESANSGNSSTYKKPLGNKNCNCGTGSQCWNDANSIYDSAKANDNEDPLLLLAIMMQESQCNVNVPNNGGSTGLMQVDSSSVSECYQSNGGVQGISSISDVTGAANYDKNIQCGALILKKKNDAYGSGTGSHVFPATSTGQTNCNGFSATYEGWNASIRGYNGYGCGGDNLYVDYVDAIYHAILDLLSSAGTSLSAVTDSQATVANHQLQNNAGTSGSTSGVSQLAVSPEQLANYNQYKSIFDKYSSPSSAGGNLPLGMSQRDFEALLLSIAQENNWGGSNNDFIMRYHPQDSAYSSVDSQVRIVSAILKAAFDGNGNSLDYQTGSAVSYSVCNSQASSGFVTQAKCILSVYNTGSPNSRGFLNIGGLFGSLGVNSGFLAANAQGDNYANAVMSSWSNWDSYFISQSS